MAYRRSNGKGHRPSKIEPAVKTLFFGAPAVDASKASYYIDLSQCASLVNRRFYRQGLNWAVGSIRIYSQAFAGQIMVSKLPETWTMSNAWEKSFRAWQAMNDDALDNTESVKPRFMDFKIYADDTHHDKGFVGNLLPQNAANPPVLAVAGEWESSKLLIPLTGPSATDPGQVTEREIIAVGASYPGTSSASGLNAVSLIEGYAASRALPDILDPNVPADAADADGGTPENWMAALDNEGTQQVDETIAVLVAENNIAPYPFENDGVNADTMYPGGANQLVGMQVHSFELLTPTTVGGQTHVKGGLFPCGLIKVEAAPLAGTVPGFAIQIDLVPGPHRGYLAQSMLEA